MHAKVGQTAGGESEALFFVDVPDAASDRMVVPPPAEIRSAYGEGRRPNWPSILLIAGFHAALLVDLIKFDVIHVRKKAPDLVVVDIAEAAPPPAEEPPAPKPETVEIVPQVLVPPPIITPPVLAPPPIAVAPPPQKVAPPMPVPPSGPVTVGNLDERLLEGQPPRYPMESRRKKEEGTVVLRLLIGTDGRIQEISIAESSGFARLDQAALQAVRTWRWQPLTRNGEPVAVRGLYTMPFKLS